MLEVVTDILTGTSVVSTSN